MFKNRWWIPFAASWINFFLFSTFRSAGVLYLSFMQTFNCSHQQAAWPISLSGSIASTVGIFTGFASHYISYRILIIFGLIVSSCSVIATYYATNIQFVTLTLGLAQGIGIGFVTCLLPAVLNQRFPDKKAVALGISYGGATLGAFIFPVLIHYFIKIHGFHDTIFYVGLISTSGLFGTFFLNSKNKSNVTNDNQLIQMNEIASVSQALPGNNNNHHHHHHHHHENQTKTSPISTINKSETNNNTRPMIEECETIVYVDQTKVYETIPEDDTSNLTDSSSSVTSDDDDDDDDENRRKSRRIGKNICNKIYKNLKHDWKIVSKYTFALCTFSYINFILDFVSFITILLDIAKDRGIDDSHAAWLLSIFSITDFLGRISPGWLSQMNLATDKNIYILSLTFLGLSMALIIIVRQWMHFVLLTLVCGFASGCQMVLSPAILADYFGVENTAITFGIVNFVCGIATLATRPLIIGSKDIYGNYQLLSYVLSFSTIGAGLLWLIESIVTLNVQRLE